MSTSPPSFTNLRLARPSFLASLAWWERAALLLGLAVVVGFSGVVELRSAFLKRPMTDLQVYLRAAWAVRTGADLYQVTDDNGWHYHYPPLLAILLAPLADPPPNVARDGIPPFGVSVAIWYWFSVGCLAWGVHTLCRALEQTASDDSIRLRPPGCGRWRLLRFLPILACLPAIGQTLVRGQVNLLVFALLCGFIAAIVRGRRVHAGFWLAGAICLKIIPALLLIYPLWKRDFRCLAGCVLGLAIGLGAIPAAVLGPQRTLGYFEEWTEVMLRPALGRGEDQSRVKELINVNATDSQSPLVLLHNAIHPDRDTRPFEASTEVRWTHRLIAASMTLITLLAAGWSRKSSPQREALALGALTIVMVLASPVCHLHYFCLTLPLVIGMLAFVMTRGESPRRLYPFLGLLTVNMICTILPIFPGMDVLRDHGLATAGTLLLWATGLGMLISTRGAPLTTYETVASDDALAA